METAAFDVVHARLLRCFPELVDELGGDAAALLGAVGIDRAALTAGQAKATYRQMIRVIAEAARVLRCPDFGMRLAVRQGGDISGPLGRVMMNCRTFGEALAVVETHAYAHSLATRLWHERQPDGGLFCGHHILIEGLSVRSQTIEQILLAGDLFSREVTGGKACARKVHFRHQPISPLATYRRHFGCEVCFGQNEDGIFYGPHDLAAPMAAPDPAARQAALGYIGRHFARRRPPTHALVREMVMQSLWSGECSNAHAAAGLGLHSRTLRRRLVEEGTSFRQIKDEVRRELLLYYLDETDLGISRISEKLGFAEQAVLTRRCRSWFGAPPTQLRERCRGASEEATVRPMRQDGDGSS